MDCCYIWPHIYLCRAVAVQRTVGGFPVLVVGVVWRLQMECGCSYRCLSFGVELGPFHYVMDVSKTATVRTVIGLYVILGLEIKVALEISGSRPVLLLWYERVLQTQLNKHLFDTVIIHIHEHQ